MRPFVTVCLLLAVLATGCQNDADTLPAEIAVSNSYLHAIVRDLCGDETAIFAVVPPGMCPGHFDIKPADVRRLHQCRLMLAFDFQEGMRNILPDGDRGPVFHTITVPPGMCIPDTYLSMANATAEILIGQYPDRKPHFQHRLEVIAERMAALETEAAATIQSLDLHQAPVLTSRHQSLFAKWLGMDVIATFSGSDSETAANINAALAASGRYALRCIIANQQEGTQLANALADRLSAPTTVFSNFPNAPADTVQSPAFDQLVRDNLRRLAEATQ